MAVQGELTLDNLLILAVDTDPTVSGVAAYPSSLALLMESTYTQAGMWIKTGSGNTAWTQIMTSSGLTQGSVLFAGSKGITQDNAQLFWNDTSHYLAIGTTSPDSPLTINANTATLPVPTTGTAPGIHLGGADASGTLILIDAFANAPQIEFRRADTSNASPSAVQSGDILMNLVAYGYGASSYQTSGAAKIVITAAENFSGSTGASSMQFYTRPSGTSGASTSRVTIDQNGGFTIAGLTSAAPVRSSSAGLLSNGAIVLTASSDVSGILPIANGGTNSSTTLNGNRIMVSSSTAIVEAAAMTNGQLLIGSTSAAPVVASLTSGNSTIVFTTGAGSLALATAQDIRTSASPSFTGLTVSGLSTTGVVHNSSAGVLSTSLVSLTADVTGVLPIANGGTNNSSAYTSGSVVFSNGTSLTQNNSNFFWDNTNIRLGIGTASPSSAIQVSASTNGNIGSNITNSSTATGNSCGYNLTNDSSAGGSFTLFGNAFAATYLQNATRVAGSKALWLVSDVNSASGGSDNIVFSVGGYNNITAQATTNGLTAINLTDTGIATSNAGAPLSITSGQVITAGIGYYEESATSAATTTSTSAVVMTSMTVTPAAGTYLVVFSGWFTASAGGDVVSIAIYNGTTLKTDSVRSSTPFSSAALAASQDMVMSTNGIVTATGSAAITIDWYTSGGTATVTQRTMNLIRIA